MRRCVGLEHRPATRRGDRSADARAWQRLAAATVAHDKAITHANRRLVFRYNRLVHRTATAQRRLMHAVKVANSAATTAGSQSTVYQTVSGGTVTLLPRAARRQRHRHRSATSNHPHQLMTTLPEHRRPRMALAGDRHHLACSPFGGCRGGRRAVAAAVEKDEARWSRFRPDSDVSRINRAAANRTVEPRHGRSPVRLPAMDAVTDGVFQPLVCTVLEQWGYGMSMAESRPAPKARKTARWWGNSRSTAST